MTPDEFEDYLFEHSAQPPRPFAEQCRICTHEYHGLACRQKVAAPGGGAAIPCMCPGGQS